jgi:hypothetical protein
MASSAVIFTLAHAPKRNMGISAQKFTNMMALALSVSTAAGALMWLECTSHIHLPFARQGCAMFPAAILHPPWL